MSFCLSETDGNYGLLGCDTMHHNCDRFPADLFAATLKVEKDNYQPDFFSHNTGALCHKSEVKQNILTGGGFQD